ncbi:MAG TPA: hypothetical protein VGJ61_00970 [Solirubrobacterales bacterium]
MPSRSIALASSLAALLLAGSGCGGGTEHHDVHPEALLDAAAAHPIESGQTEIEIRLQVHGMAQLTSPLTLKLDGPYVSGRGVRIPSFDWKLTAGALGFPVGGQVASTGTNVFLSVYGDNYEVGVEPIAAANARIREAAAAGRSPLSLRPRAWFGPARYDGEGNEGDVDCARISGPLRGRVIESQLTPLTEQLGLSAPPAVSGTARACVGFDDHTFHQLGLDAEIAIPPEDRSRLGGATGAHVSADVDLADIGQPQQISIPGDGYRPIRDLLLSLNDLGVPIPL